MVWVLVDIAGRHYWTDDGSFLPMDMEPLPSDTIATFPDLPWAQEEIAQQRAVGIYLRAVWIPSSLMCRLPADTTFTAN